MAPFFSSGTKMIYALIAKRLAEAEPVIMRKSCPIRLETVI